MPTERALRRVCLTPRAAGVGGMVSFQAKLTTGLSGRGVQVTHDLADESVDAVLVVGGTRQLVALRRRLRSGIPIAQRLDGMNWLHRRLRTGIRHWLRAEIGNWILAYIRQRLATRTVYQSQFAKGWWRRVYGDGPSKSSVILNGLDLALFSPGEANLPINDKIRILMVEGNLQGGYELGLDSAIALAETLQVNGSTVELTVAGQVKDQVKAKWSQWTKSSITWAGVVPNEDLPRFYRNAHFLFSGDINAACPNSVVEAMACGLPVLAFDTGALKELVSSNAGCVVPYGGDPWKLDPPDIAALARGAREILANQEMFRSAARARAEEAFGLDRMVNAYVEALSA